MSTHAKRNIYMTDELEAIYDQTVDFVSKEVTPHGEAWEEAGKVPRDVLRQMGDLGMLSLRIPEAHGGLGMGMLASATFSEALGASTFAGFDVTVLVHTDMAGPHLLRAGNDAQCDKYMPAITAGEKITAIAVTEPDGGSDVAAMKTTARRKGGDWVLNGAKMFITNGVYGDLYFVAARTDPDVKASRGITMFIVEKGTPGFRVSRALKKRGMLSGDTAELSFEDCRIPAENILGEENKGFYSIMRNFQNERMVLGAQNMAVAEKAIEITLDYVRQRKAFGGVLFDKQAIRQRLAMLLSKVVAGRQLVHHSAWLDACGQDCIKEMSMVKAYCGELVNEVLYACQQFHGGAGYLRETAIERMARDVRIEPIGGGATEVMLEEIAKRF